MAKVDVIDGIRENDWDRMIDEHPLSSVFQHSSFKKVIMSTFSHTKPYYIALIDRKGDITAGIPLFLVKSWLTGNRLVSFPFALYSDPLVRSMEEFDQLFVKILEIYEREKASYLEIKARSTAALLERINTMVPVLCHKAHCLNLVGSLDDIWGKLHRTCIVPRQQEWHRLWFLVRGEFQAVSWGGRKLLEIANFSSIIGFFTPRKELNNGKTKGCYPANQKGYTTPVLRR